MGVRLASTRTLEVWTKLAGTGQLLDVKRAGNFSGFFHIFTYMEDLVMTHKELKRASYIYAKKEAGILLTPTEQDFLREHEKEYLESDFHKEEQITEADKQILRKMFNIPEGVDMDEFLKETRRKALRKKFPKNRLIEKD